jgi:rhodanese-related sulfurtransferase
MQVTTSLKRMNFSEAMSHIHAGAAFLDMRPVDDYLDVHIPGSIGLQFEAGPGFQSRARDCLPLDVPLILLDLGTGESVRACASLRGKGFTVLGDITNGVNEWSRWHGTPASTEIYRGPMPTRTFVLDVGDPGVTGAAGATHIPIEKLWDRIEEVTGEPRVTIAAGYGLRAALAVGMLERAGAKEIVFWKTRNQPGSL